MQLVSANQKQRAAVWADLDPNPVSSAYLKSLLDDETKTEELAAAFPVDPSERIAFGTAGLRSTMSVGPMGMNDLVVVQTAQGLARYCLDQTREGKPTAVIGYDHRSNSLLQLSSLSFAIWSAIVFIEAGFEVLLLEGFSLTPLIPFCVQQLSATVGIQITASHNAKQDNGYKVYWSDGCQIRSPIDHGIAASIQQNLTPWKGYAKILQDRKQKYPNDLCVGLADKDRTSKMTRAYFDAVAGLVTKPPSTQPPLSFCYTAMHGVGYRYAVQSFETFGQPHLVSVPAQQEPDPSFPTVAFPNPEEPGALDLAKAYAEENKCPIVLANDPDADRLAVAEQLKDGTWTIFTGDQLGTMLGHWLFTIYSRDKSKEEIAKLSMCASTVSSKMLAEIARVEGFHFEDTLTGFKWIGSRAKELSSSGYRNIFAYEEAIGFCCGDVIFDKDGISAMGVLSELATSVYSRGQTLAEHMQGLYNKYGEFVSSNGYFYLKDSARVVPQLMDRMTNGGTFESLTAVGPYAVASVRYLGVPGYDSTRDDKKPVLPCSMSSPMLMLAFENRAVLSLRASGTEPKFKYYMELPGKPGVSRDNVEQELLTMKEFVLEDLLHPSEYGLERRV